MYRRLNIFIFFALSFLLWIGEFWGSDLFKDLEIVEEFERREREKPPFHADHYLIGGYINMHSARTGKTGDLGIGASWVNPYTNYNIAFRPFDRLEVSGNYRIFKGVADKNLTHLGFGDYADKGANIKVALLRPEESDYQLPGIALGIDDFLGTKLFQSQYLVLTKVWPEQDFELSIGYGTKRLDGFFGGAAWMPFRRIPMLRFLKGLSFLLEYDATDYEDPHKEPHPRGRVKRSPYNFGVSYRLWNSLYCSVSQVRGDALAASVSLQYNIADIRGALPAIEDKMPYSAPVNREPLGASRSTRTMSHDFVYAFRERGIKIIEMRLGANPEGKKTLFLQLENKKYRHEKKLQEHLVPLLRSLVPNDIEEVIVTMNYSGLQTQQYRYRGSDLKRSLERRVSDFELGIISGKRDVQWQDKLLSKEIYRSTPSRFNFGIYPRWRSFFGSSKGKFKYTLGLSGRVDGYLFANIYYNVNCGYSIVSDLDDVGDTDILNPSQVINVTSDYVRYYKESHFSVDQAYLQKSWNCGRGWYSRLAAGHFEPAFGGVAAEFLYYPMDSLWAIGIESALLKKRRYSGLGFKKQVRQLDGFTPTYVDYIGRQTLVDCYFELPAFDMDLKFRAGRFLAHDQGVRTEVSRTFSSGLKISLWYTLTDGRDILNGSRYYDKGLSFSMPLDVFYKYSSRKEWGYGMSAWLRDVGALSATGKSLHSILSAERKR